MAPCCRCCWAGAPAPQGSPPSQMGPCKQRPHTLCGFWAAGPFGAFLAAPGPRFGRGPCPCRGPRRAAAPAGPVGPPVRPQRPSGPFRPLPGAGPPLLPPRSPARALVRPVGLRGLSLGPLPRPSPFCAAASLFGRPCFVRGRPLGLGSPRGGFAAAPLSRLRARRLPAGPPGGLSAAFFPSGGPALVGCAARPAGPCCASPGVLCSAGVLPCAPRPPPPLGAPGARCPMGLRPASRAPEGLPPRTPLRGAGPCRGGPRPAFSARFTFRKLSTMVPARRPSDHNRPVKAAHPARGLGSCFTQARGLDWPIAGNLPGGP